MKFDYLIVGSGIAGISAVETLRKFDKNAKIGLVSNEPHDPYSKVLLPFYLKGKIRYDQLFIRGKNFWQKNNIEFIYGEVIGLDRSARKITVNGGQDFFYKKLLIASGASAKKLDFFENNLPGVFYFHDLDDTLKIEKYLNIFYSDTPVYQHTPVYQSDGLKPVIYGASFIALEFAGIFAYLDIGAKIIFRGPYFWSRLLDSQGGKLIEDFLEQAGMEIHRNEQIIDDRLLSVNSNFVGLGIGLEPNLEFARQADVKVNHGIITDEFLQTSDSHIFAAGDIVEFYDIIIGHHHVLGNWLNSEMQGRVAAMNMLGIKRPFELISFYNFNFEGKKGVGAFNICALGDTNPQEPFNVKIFYRDNKYIKVLIKNNQCVGFVLVNLPQFREKCISLIKNKIEPAKFSNLLDL